MIEFGMFLVALFWTYHAVCAFIRVPRREKTDSLLAGIAFLGIALYTVVRVCT